MISCSKCKAQISSDAQMCPHCGYELEPLPERGMQSQIRQLLMEGNKIQAIKIHREATGMGLKESKDAVEAVEAELRSSGQLPQKSTGGCLILFGLPLPILLIILL